MNKLLLGILLGVLSGAGVTWLALHRHGAAESASVKAPAEKAPEKENPLRLSPAKRTAAGIILAKPMAVTLASEVPVFGRVLDATSLVTLLGEWETARVASGATEKEAERVKKLFAAGGNASGQAVESAEANAARDRTALASTRARLIATWGRDLAGGLDAIGKALEEGATLVRLEVLPDENFPTSVKTARIGLVGTNETFEAEVLGSAPVADPQAPGASFLALVRGRSLAAGAALRGTIAGVGDAAHALEAPRSAVVYHQGSAWVFVLGEEDTFERKLVSLGRSMGDDRVAITQGLEATEQVVTTGAQQLLAAELQAGGAPEAD